MSYNPLNSVIPLGRRLTHSELFAIAEGEAFPELLSQARNLRDAGHGQLISYSRKVFIPLTKLCRDTCSYCTFAQPPKRGEPCYLSPDEVVAIARAGVAAGCREALFTLGDKPEKRYRAAREELEQRGHATTLSYLREMCALVIEDTGLLPHVNPGVMDTDNIAALRRVSISQGIMLESVSERLCQRGGPHYGSPDKAPAVRLETIRLAGEARVPFTSGILIGIGETRVERLQALLALRDLHDRYGHLQEVIIQNFRAKPNTRMASAPEPDLNDLMWTIALARLTFGPLMNIQAPPNLSGATFGELIDAGINDWGGISPVTPDHVNPESPWPHLERLRRETEKRGKSLVERLAAYPAYCLNAGEWQDPALRPLVLQSIDATGLSRTDEWTVGKSAKYGPPPLDHSRSSRKTDSKVLSAIARACQGETLDEDDIAYLFAVRDTDFDAVCVAADRLRRLTVGDDVTYAVNRNINYTNVCTYRCQFCAFSKGKMSENLRGTPYDLAPEEITRRVAEAWDRGATEVCMQGGIHPRYTGQTYLELCRMVKSAAPRMHIHAFSPLEIQQGAQTINISVEAYLSMLRDEGLASLPGTAAEILDDEVRAQLCPDKLNTAEWLEIIETAHRIGLRTTATIMFGHIDQPKHWARHLLRIRRLQQRTGGFTEFVPLPFVHMEAPIYLKGRARKGPTFREAVLMHAVARLALHPVISNIQVSWVKMGIGGVLACLNAGANDLGGTLMNESISRAAGAEHGQELPPLQMEALIRSAGRNPRMRTTLYGSPSAERRNRAVDAPALSSIVLTPLRDVKGDRLIASS